MALAEINPDTGSKLIGYSRSVSPKPIDRFQVFGERRSGTNFVMNVVKKNTGLHFVKVYGWKHGIPYFPVFPACCLFIVVVRDPLDWVQSFYKGPYEGDRSLARLPFSEFIRSEWEGRYRPVRSPWHRHGYRLDKSIGRGEALQLDRHPIEGRRFRNIMEMRNIKLAGQLSMLNRGINAVLIRYEDMKQFRREIIQEISGIFDIALNPVFDPVEQTVGPKSFNAEQAEGSDGLSPADREFIIGELDPMLEARCGYVI